MKLSRRTVTSGLIGGLAASTMLGSSTRPSNAYSLGAAAPIAGLANHRAIKAQAFLPELREEEASPTIKAIYADIKQASGTPLVNLIYRHLATIPGGLEWVWGSINAAWGYDGLQQAARRMPAAEAVTTLPPSLWHAANVSAQDLAAIKALIDDYNTTNATNLLAMTALSQVLRQPSVLKGDLPPLPLTRGGKPVAAAGPPVPRMDTMAPDLRDLVLFTNNLGETEPPALVASMFRHLSIWPGSLAIATTILTPLAQSGHLKRLQHEAVSAAESLGADLVAHVPAGFPALPVPQSRQPILEALDLFRTTLIPKLLPIGHILRRAMG